MSGDVPKPPEVLDKIVDIVLAHKPEGREGQDREEAEEDCALTESPASLVKSFEFARTLGFHYGLP